MVPFVSLGTVFYSYSIVTMALSCTVFDVKRDIGRKSRLFYNHPAFDAPDRGYQSEYCNDVWYGEN